MLPALVIALLDAHAGVVTRPELLRLGFTPGQIEGWVSRKHLVPVVIDGVRLRGTYRRPGSAHPSSQRLAAMVKRCRPNARLSGPAALGLAGVEGFSGDDDPIIVVPPERTVTNVPFRVQQCRHVDRFRAVSCGIETVTVARALVDAALVLPEKAWRVGFDAARFANRVTEGALLACAKVLEHPGADAVLVIRASGALEQESEGERALAPILAGLPVRWQAELENGRRADALLTDVPLVIEYLGEAAHGPARREDDERRIAELRDLGYAVILVRKEDLRDPKLLRARIDAARAALLAAAR